jgi:hypothetical protein
VARSRAGLRDTGDVTPNADRPDAFAVSVRPRSLGTDFPQAGDRLGRIDRRALAASVAAAVFRLDLLLVAPALLWLVATVVPSDRVDAVAAAGMSLCLPLTLGMAACAVLAIASRAPRIEWDVVGLGLATAIGLVLLLLGAQLAAMGGMFSPRRIGFLIIIVGVAVWLVGSLGPAIVALLRGPRMEEQRQAVWAWDRASLGWLAGWAIVAILALGLGVFYRLESPVPFQPTWDPFVHLRVIDGLLDKVWSLWTTDYTTAFRVNAYFPIHHLTIAMSAVLTGVEPLAVYWGGPIVMPIALGTLGYAVASRFVGLRLPAILAGVVTVLAAFPLQAFHFLALAPASYAGLFFPIVLLVVADTSRSVRSAVVAVMILGVGAAVLHFLIGPAVLAFGVIAVLFRELAVRHRWMVIATLAACAAVTVLLVLAYVDAVRVPDLQLNLPVDEGEHDFIRLHTLYERQIDLVRRISLVLAAGSGIGACMIAARGLRGRLGAVPVWLAALWALTFVVVFLPIPGGDRSFLVLPAVVGPPVAILVDWVEARLLRPGSTIRDRSLVAGAVGAVLLVAVWQPVDGFIANQRNQSREAGVLSSFGAQEAALAAILKRATPPEAFIVSDPMTQEFIGGLASREAYGGGPYASDPLIEGLREAYLAPSSADAWIAFTEAAKAGGARDGAPVLIVFEGRTARWLVSPPGVWIGYYSRLAPYLQPKAPKDPAAALENLSDDRYFQPLWSSEDVKVFGLRPGPDEPVPGVRASGPMPDGLGA